MTRRRSARRNAHSELGTTTATAIADIVRSASAIATRNQTLDFPMPAVVVSPSRMDGNWLGGDAMLGTASPAFFRGSGGGPLFGAAEAGRSSAML